MPRRNESFYPYDEELKELLKQCKTAHDRKIVLNSRRLFILTEDGRDTTTCVLPGDVYDRLAKLSVSYRTLAYQKWRKDVSNSA